MGVWVAEPIVNMYLDFKVSFKMIPQSSRISFILRYWRTVAASAE
jgi:hypothetical protein